MAAIDAIRANLFAAPMPDMPAKLREIWQVAFMFRRKYSNPSGCDEDAARFFSSAWSDALAIAEAYGNSDTVQSLMVEVYLDIERQWKAVQARQERPLPEQ